MTERMSKEATERRQQRLEACMRQTERNLNANINAFFYTGEPGFPPPVWTGGAPIMHGAVTSESLARFTYRPTQVNKDAHLRKDEIKRYVEKAMQLRDARKGMPVVSSPIWAPAK